MKNLFLSILLIFTGVGSAMAAGHTVVIGGTNVTCYNACDGTATANVTGGVGPYDYSWSGPNSFTANTATVTNLCAGVYTVTVTDNNDQSTATENITITQPTELLIAFDNNGQGACWNCSAFINAIVTGGTAPYTYMWSTGITYPQLYQACPGTYDLTVTDANGCVATNQVIVQPANPPITIVTDNQTNLDCTTPSGSITIHATGGTGVYSYLWYPNGETTASVSNLTEGSYYVQVSDDSGDSCSAFQDFVITNTYNLYAAITNTPANCGDNGTAALTVQGANPPFTYLWSQGGETTNTLTGLAPGTYPVIVTDATGCSVYGTTTIASTCMNTVQGRVYNDLNQNCVQDVGEPGLSGIAIYATPGYYYGYTDANGDYSIQTPEMNPTVTVQNYYQTYFTPTCPATGSATVTFAQQGDLSSNNDFGYWADPNYFDLDIHPGWTSAHPGFNKDYWFLYANNSPTAQNALVRFIYDPALTYLSCTQGGVHYPADHKIEWTFNNLAPGSYWNWSNRPMAFFNVPVSVALTDLLHTDFAILPINGDAVPANNVLVLDEIVTGSHDPNDKSVIPRGDGPTGNILQSDSVLFYTIHFQNDGTDTAYTVVLIDTLSTHLDPGSIIPGASSHPYTFSLSGHGVMTFRFDHIMLPDSNVNEPASNGYVNYTVKIRSNTPVNTVIENTAYIYFDFNEAVITNTTVNTITKPDAIDEHTTFDVSVYPNPSSGLVAIESDIKKGMYQVSDIRGRNLLQGTVSSQRFSVDLSTFSKGLYFITVTDGKNNLYGKVVKE